MARRKLMHWVSGSGMIGCLYDNGPHFSKTRREAIDAVLFAFDDLPEQVLRAAEVALKRDGIYYFENASEAGAHYCEVSNANGPCPNVEDY